MFVRASSLLLLCACLGSLPAPAPMPSRTWSQPATAPHARCLVVFLPGRGDNASDFERHGFVGEVRQRGLSVDMVAADATLGYYARGTFLERLARDVVEPARARGYRQVWLIGNSLGGIGSLYYARGGTSDVTGVLALAPYLGERELIDEIDDQGGIATWQGPPRVDALTPGNYLREIWRWIQAMGRGAERGPDIYLGFGRSDRFAHAGALLAEGLPDDHVLVIPGGHDWTTWRRLFDQFVRDSDFTRDCR